MALSIDKAAAADQHLPKQARGAAVRAGIAWGYRIVAEQVRRGDTRGTMTDESIPSAPLTALDVCNLALSKLGESPLSAIDPNGGLAARLCYMHYHPVRREVLCANRWSFATVETTLTAPEGSGETGSASLAHTLPSDCLRVTKVNSPGWTLRGRCIYCPAATIRVQYIADCEDVSTFDPLFIEAFATRLACKLCIPLINSTTARQALAEEYQRLALPQAAHFNAVQANSNDQHPLYRLWKQSMQHGE